MKAFTLINEQYWQSGYMNTVKGITDKHRNHLPDIVTFIYAIINYHKKKASEFQFQKERLLEVFSSSSFQNLKSKSLMLIMHALKSS